MPARQSGLRDSRLITRPVYITEVGTVQPYEGAVLIMAVAPVGLPDTAGGIMVDSGAAGSTCPRNFGGSEVRIPVP